jgi:hypothetical protein
MESDLRIVILQRGWVMVGKFSQSGDQCRLDDAQVIRKWGTSRGLGELRSGPLPSTVLDPAGQVDFNALTVVATIRVEADPWIKACAA